MGLGEEHVLPVDILSIRMYDPDTARPLAPRLPAALVVADLTAAGAPLLVLLVAAGPPLVIDSTEDSCSLREWFNKLSTVN